MARNAISTASAMKRWLVGVLTISGALSQVLDPSQSTYYSNRALCHSKVRLPAEPSHRYLEALIRMALYRTADLVAIVYVAGIICLCL